VLEAVELPAGVADLDTGLADVDRDALPHGGAVVGYFAADEMEEEVVGGKAKARRRGERRVRRRLSLRCLCLGFPPPTLASIYSAAGWSACEGMRVALLRPPPSNCFVLASCSQRSGCSAAPRELVGPVWGIGGV
jgi:hypothetical protein